MKEVSDVLGLPTPDHRLPFEAEVGAHPSFEEMQVAVSRNKMRPAFPDLWKNTNMVQGLTMLCYVIITTLNKNCYQARLCSFFAGGGTSTV